MTASGTAAQQMDRSRRAAQFAVSVIICAHNPRSDYLIRVLDALAKQTFRKDQWELLLIDNASDSALAVEYDLSWHPHARHCRENQLGLTPARLRGILESSGELLVLVDDDNVLAPTYLEQGLAIRKEMPALEVLGSGDISAIFETEPEAWMRPYLSMFALRSIDRPIWTNDPMSARLYPCGAGMMVTRKVADEYQLRLEADPLRRQLGRRGPSLTSAEDCDICFTAGAMGLGVGVFPSLKLTHLIPASRINKAYMLQLSEGICFSGCLLEYLWKGKTPPARRLMWYVDYWRRHRKLLPIERLFARAWARGEARALEIIGAINQESAARRA